VYPTMTLNVYQGDLGINDGTPRSVYTLDTSSMQQLDGPGTDQASLQLQPGQTADLPDGLGTVTFENEAAPGATTFDGSVKRFVSLSIHRDLAAPWVLAFAVTAILGLLSALFIPRRRMWMKATPQGSAVRLEYAGLARGEDPALAGAVAQFAQKHATSLP
jgi:cytochrome c biogenesis protein